MSSSKASLGMARVEDVQSIGNERSGILCQAESEAEPAGFGGGGNPHRDAEDPRGASSDVRRSENAGGAGGRELGVRAVAGAEIDAGERAVLFVVQ